MEANIFTNVVLPVALAVIMLGLGLTLTRDDFLRVVIFPKAFVIGLTCQMVLLPLAGFVIAKLFPMEPQLAVGVMILALCPAGATANLITYLARGDVALGITLTAFNSIIIIVTTPILINLSLAHFLGETQEIRLPVLRTIIQVGAIILIPVSIGMLIRARKPKLAFAAERPVRYLSMVFIVIAVLGAVLQDVENLPSHFRQAGLSMLALNVLTLWMGYTVARLFRLPLKQAIAIAIEGGIQNGTLAILIASTILKQPAMSIPAAVYSLIMFATGAFMVYYFGRRAQRGCPRDGVLAAPARVVEPLNLDQIAVRVAGEQVVDVVPLVVGGRLGDFDAVRLQVCVPFVDGGRDQRQDHALGGLGRLRAAAKAQIARPRHTVDAAVHLLQRTGQAQRLLVELARRLPVRRRQKRDELCDRWACHGMNYDRFTQAIHLNLSAS
jgi:BASS family bile acid:Na+ symporter